MHMRQERATVLQQDRIAPTQPFPQELRLQAVLLAGAELPSMHKRSVLVQAGPLVAIAIPTAAPANGWDDLSPGLRAFTPEVRILSEPTYPSATALCAALRTHEDDLLNVLWTRSAFAEQRILLTTATQVAAQSGLTGTQARLVARLAETVRGVSQKVCLTPPALTGPAHGSVHMALSLLVGQQQLPETEHALELAGRMMGIHDMTLAVTPPGPVESFPIRGFG